MTKLRFEKFAESTHFSVGEAVIRTAKAQSETPLNIKALTSVGAVSNRAFGLNKYPFG